MGHWALGIGHWGNLAIHILRDKMAFVNNIRVFLLAIILVFYTNFELCHLC
jgi:hypothetical protein